MKNIAIFIFLASSSSWAAIPEVLLERHPNTFKQLEVYGFRAITGHHFSEEAPQSCGSGLLVEKSADLVQCQFVQAGKGAIVLNVCDDKKTFCKPVQVQVDVLANKAGANQPLAKNQSLNQALRHQLVPGFQEGGVDEIRDLVAKKGQPVLAIVSTDWCPPCNEAKEFILSQKAFQEQASQWFSLYVDGDSLNATKWEKVIPFRYYPSFVLLNDKLEVLDRYYGKIRLQSFLTWLKQAREIKTPISEVYEKFNRAQDKKWWQRWADKIGGANEPLTKESLERLLLWAMDRPDPQLVSRILAQTQFPNLELKILRFQLDHEEASDKKTALLKKILQLSYQDDDWSASLSELCDLDKDQCKSQLSKLPGRLEFLEKGTSLSVAEKLSRNAEEYLYLAGVFETLGNPSDAKKYARLCAQNFARMRKESPLPVSRASLQGLAVCHEIAEDFADEEKVLRELISKYPNEPTFHMRRAKMLKKQKRYAESQNALRLAEQKAYGYNWYSLKVLSAEIFLEAKEYEKAQSVIETALEKIELDSSQKSRNQVYLARLRSLETKVRNAQSGPVKAQ